MTTSTTGTRASATVWASSPPPKEALAARQVKVDEYFERIHKGAHSFRELWEGYMPYGEDPFISNDDTEPRFSAWAYAERRCLEYAARKPVSFPLQKAPAAAHRRRKETPSLTCRQSLYHFSGYSRQTEGQFDACGP